MTQVRELSSLPHPAVLYGRAALPMIPLASRLPFVAGGSKEIPDLELHVPELRVDRERLRRYNAVCGFLRDDALPVTYPFALAVPLHMALMTDGSFPFGAIGLVHVRNRIEQHRPITPDEPLDVRVRATGLQPHPKGRTFDLLTDVTVGGETAWTCVSTILRRGKGIDDAAEKGADPIDAVPVDLAALTTSRWDVPDDIGRRYAAVSGDINPIHLHPLSAKALGFPRAIAHGMWTKARSLAAIEDLLPDAVTVDVRFQKPVLLPATVEFGAVEPGDGRVGFALQDAEKRVPHLRGLVVPR
jgi:acyl dehydratase